MTRYAYFLDVDGTLVNLAASPESVRIDRRLPAQLRRLARRAGGAVALISGRSLHDLDRLFPGLHLPAAGQHGVERRTAAGRRTRARAQASRLDAARRGLRPWLRRHAALQLEDKGLSLALHYRRAPHLADVAARAMQRAHALAGRAFVQQRGKYVIELTPAGRHKGAAVRAFLLEYPFRGRIPVFVGDDVTDERGFAEVQAVGGIGIKVGRGHTAAHWRVSGAAAVRRWLNTRTWLPERRRTRPV